jgi:phosphohistidine phosphatase SixA
MSTTDVRTDTSAHSRPSGTIDMKLEVVTLPVSDVDRAKRFYESLGWRLDVDIALGDIRGVQFTPTRSNASITFGKGLTTAEPGSVQRLELVVSDIVAAREDLIARGVEVSELFHRGEDGFLPGPDPERRSYLTYASFSDPDGTGGCCKRSRRGSRAVSGKTDGRRRPGAVQRHHVCVKRVYLLRHAKSSWKDTALADHDRPLAGRGRQAAQAMCDHLRAQGIDPELVRCSTARRARETLAWVEPALGRREVRVERALYGASADALIARLRQLPSELESVLVIGHNPGLQELALELARPRPERHVLASKFPTAALATLELPIDNWRELGPGTAELAALVRPRDLIA